MALLAYLVPTTKAGAFRLCRLLFVLGVILFVGGMAVDVVPGSDDGYFVVSAAFLAFGLVSFSRAQRITAFIFVALSLYYSYREHQLGIQYYSWLREHHPSDPLLKNQR